MILGALLLGDVDVGRHRRVEALVGGQGRRPVGGAGLVVVAAEGLDRRQDRRERIGLVLEHGGDESLYGMPPSILRSRTGESTCGHAAPATSRLTSPK